MPNPYHDPRNGRFTTKQGAVANFGGSSAGMNRRRLSEVRQQRRADAANFVDPAGTRWAQLSRVRAGVERRSRAAYGKTGVHTPPERVRAITDNTNRRLAKIRVNQESIRDTTLASKKFGSKRPGAGSGATDKYVAATEDLTYLRGKLNPTKPTKRADMAKYVAMRKSQRPKGGTAASRRRAEDEANAMIHRLNYEDKPKKPKGWTANSMPIRIVSADSLPVTGTPRGRGRSK